MERNSKGGRVLYWTPRLLAVLLIAFLAMLAFDVFGQGYTFWETLIALFMHLVPNFILIIILLIAWKWERVGGALFIALAVIYLVMMTGRLESPAQYFIASPLFLIGILFLLNKFIKEKVEISAKV